MLLLLYHIKAVDKNEGIIYTEILKYNRDVISERLQKGYQYIRPTASIGSNKNYEEFV